MARISGSSPRPARLRRMRAGSTAVAVLVVAAAVAGCGTSTPVAHPRSEAPLGFRPPPSYLPTSQPPVDQVVTAAPGHPQLAAQGVGLRVEMPSGKTLATVTGPRVPPFVTPPPPDVTATFDLSLAQVSGTVPVRLDQFTITDQLGRTFHPTWVRGVAPPPATVTTGHTTTFQVTAVMPTGEGRLYWSPTGATPYAAWDFIVEND